MFHPVIGCARMKQGMIVMGIERTVRRMRHRTEQKRGDMDAKKVETRIPIGQCWVCGAPEVKPSVQITPLGPVGMIRCQRCAASIIAPSQNSQMPEMILGADGMPTASETALQQILFRLIQKWNDPPSGFVASKVASKLWDELVSRVNLFPEEDGLRDRILSEVRNAFGAAGFNRREDPKPDQDQDQKPEDAADVQADGQPEAVPA